LSADLSDFDYRVESDAIYLIDFGLAKTIPPAASIDHRAECREPITNDVVGTPRYCSKRAHRRRSMCERDDLLSLIYVAVFVAQNALPWASHYRGDDRNKLIGLHKARTHSRDLCANAGLPAGMCEFAEAVDLLQFGERPRYSDYIEAINADMERLRTTDKSYLRHVSDSRIAGECLSDINSEGMTPLCCAWNREHEYNVLFDTVEDPKADALHSSSSLSPLDDDLEELRMADAMARMAVTPPLSPASSPGVDRAKSLSKSKSKRSKSSKAKEMPARSPFREVQISIPRSEYGIGNSSRRGAVDLIEKRDKLGDVTLDLKKPAATVPTTKKKGGMLSALSARIKLGKERVVDGDDLVESESPRKKRKVCV
jgi:serine/threonine protein kinase